MLNVLDKATISSLEDINLIFHQDNCPIHKNNKVKKLFQDHEVKLLEFPAYRPNLNIIENVWGIIKRSLLNERNNIGTR